MGVRERHRPLLYVAGPYTRPDPPANMHYVCRVADVIYSQTHWCPIVPHLSLVWQIVSPRPEEHWYGYDLDIMRGCSGIVRLPGYSVGADYEMQVANEIGMHVVPFESLPPEAVAAWAGRGLKSE